MFLRRFAAFAATILAAPFVALSQSATAPTAPPTTMPVGTGSSVKPTPPTPPDKAAARFHLKDGYEVELMVSEPLVIDPVAMAFGPDGKLWVIEMTEYPLGKHGTMDPSGRVVYLESTHGDGKYDKVTVFAENLNFPNGIIPWHKGVIVTSAPNILYLEDTTGSGKADKKEILYTGFTQGNPQLRINSPTWGLDNWIYLANGLSSHDEAKSTKTGETIKTAHHDVRIRPDEGHIEAETGESQYGRKMDNWGNWFGVHNSYPARAFMIPQRYADRNPLVQLPDGLDDCGWPRNPKVFPVSKGTKRYGYYFFVQAGHFTSACSVTPYRDDLLFGPQDPKSAMDHIFVCEPAHNLVQHIVAAPTGSGYLLQRAADEQFNDFLASDDDWCRPVFLSSGPDGALWVIDMYRFFIDHPEYLPEEGQKDMKPYYRLGEDKGRIYRIYPKGKKPRPIPRLDQLDAPQLAAAMESPSGWQRDMAQMMLVWKKDGASIAPLEHLASDSANPFTRMQAMCTLDGLDKLSPALIDKALHDACPAVRRQAIRLAETRAAANPGLIDAVAALAGDSDAMVRLQLAFTLGQWESPRAGKALAQIAVGAGDDTYLSAAVMSSATHHYEAIADGLITAGKAGPMTRDLLRMALELNNRDLAARILAPVLESKNGSFTIEQMNAFLSFVIDLSQRHTSIAKLAAEKPDALSERLAKSGALYDAARRLVISTDQPDPVRVTAAELLGRDVKEKQAEDFKELATLLTPKTSAALRTAAVHAIGRTYRDDVPDVLLQSWNDDPRPVRDAVLDVLIYEEPWAFDLLTRVQKGKFIAAEIDLGHRDWLLRHGSPRIKALADKTVGASSILNREKVVENYGPVYTLTGDVERGAKVFQQNCTACHHLANMGNEIGPNLQSVAHWPIDQFLVAILDPSRSAEPRYLSYNCELDTGETVYGLLVTESAAGVTIKGLDAKDRQIPRKQIKSLECTNRSLMPDGLEAAIDKQQMADLIKFVQSQK